MADEFKPYASLYANQNGPGDARPTALQIINDNHLANQWAGKVVLITGGTSGLGLETARALHATGADVFITARNSQKGQAAIDDIRKSSAGTGNLDMVEMDMNSLSSVKSASQAFLSKSDRLNILINNAGIMAVPERVETVDGFEQQFGVNHLAHFALTTLLLPTLLSSSTPSSNSRIISVTSSGHRYSPLNWDDVNSETAYSPWAAYGQSKTANIWMTNYINRFYGSRGVHANAVHPGGSMTSLHQHVSAEMAEEWGRDPAMVAIMQNLDQGAATTTWAAVANVLEGQGGKYLCNCGVGEPAKDMMAIPDPGYAPHAFDKDGEERLWNLSKEFVGAKI